MQMMLYLLQTASILLWKLPFLAQTISFHDWNDTVCIKNRSIQLRKIYFLLQTGIVCVRIWAWMTDYQGILIPPSMAQASACALSYITYDNSIIPLNGASVRLCLWVTLHTIIQLFLFFHKNHLHCCTTSPPVSLQSPLLPGYYEYKLAFVETFPDSIVISVDYAVAKIANSHCYCSSCLPFPSSREHHSFRLSPV